MIKRISSCEYEELLHKAKVIKKRAGRPGIFITPENKIIKLIYKSGILSLSRSRRVWCMLRNAKKLAELKIPSFTIEQCFYYSQKRCYIIIYPKVSGTPVAKITEPMLAFIAKLHANGIYFHDLLTKNILSQGDADFAIIDIDCLDIYQTALPLSIRAKNLSFFIVEDYLKVNDFGLDKLIKCYLQYSGLAKSEHAKLYQELQQQLRAKIAESSAKVDKLQQLGIMVQAPDINVNYVAITGKSVKKLLQTKETTILEDLARFFAYLHLHGVFISTINFAAIITQKNNKFALLDIQWVEKIQRKPLSLQERIRSLSGVMRIESTAIMESLGLREFITGYMQASTLTKRQQNKFYKHLEKKLLKRGGIKF